MMMRALSILVMSSLTAVVAGCSHHDDVRGGMMSDSHDAGETQAGRHDGIARDDDEDDEVEVTLANCPPAVQATIAKYLDGGSINEIERTSRGNFEVEAVGNTGQFEFGVASDGTYLGAEDDDDDDDDDDDR